MDSTYNDAPKKRPITRRRELRTCTECRTRKLKCDRQQPCVSCIKRNEASSCLYERGSGSREHERRLQAEARLEHLEQLVQQLSQPKQTVADGNSASISSSTAQLSTDFLCNGATHWSAMLEDIEELRNVIREDDQADDANVDIGDAEDKGLNLLFGARKTLSYEEVVSQRLPPKDKADRLIATYFRAKTVAAPYIHGAHFMRLYGLFWDNPFATSPLWTSMLFSIFSPDDYAIAAANCLIAGEYHKPQQFAVEALLLYTHSTCLTSVDISPVVGVIMGILVRLATTMSYHRDPDALSERISAFEGEMRRRAWSLLMQLDMLVSFQLGLPTNIQFPTWDTRPPTNLLDSDFDENVAQLPPARPDSEPTELRFYIAKHRLMAVFEKIIRHTLSTMEQPNEGLETIEQELRDTYAALPAIFHSRSMAESIVDSPSIIVARLCVSFIFHKCLCVLHRKYVAQNRWKSVQICHDSASELLRQFLDIYKEFAPGGSLQTERWFMGGITWHDFLLACTALCLTLCSSQSFADDPSKFPIIDIWGSVELLHKAKDICEKHSIKSKDTRKVQRLIENVVMNFTQKDNGQIPNPQTLVFPSENQVPEADWQALLASYGDADWLWNNGVVESLDDSSWTSLNLSNDDVLMHI